MKDPQFDPPRRPNPKGWTKPRAPYNPYDPADARPPEGYPSEYNIPGNAPSGFSSIPNQPTQYKKVNETMKKLNYTPRPVSELYPGQFKVLRKVDTNRRVNLGSKWFGSFISTSIVIYGIFYYRWNDGFENVTSEFYRARLSLQENFTLLTDEEYSDLYYPKGSQMVVRHVKDTDYIPEDIRRSKESDLAMNRPAERHVLEAQRIQQQREEMGLRAEDQEVPRKKWLGVF